MVLLLSGFHPAQGSCTPWYRAQAGWATVGARLASGSKSRCSPRYSPCFFQDYGWGVTLGWPGDPRAV